MSKLSLAFVLPVAFAACAQAQMMMPFGLNGKVMLVETREVKKEIKLSPDQDKQIQSLLKDAEKNASSYGLPDMHYMTRALDQRLDSILNADQSARLQQLFLQANGLLTLTEKSVSDALGISDDVLNQAKSIIKTRDKDTMDAAMSVQKTKKFDQKKIDEINKSANDALVALLTAEQVEKWKSMQGAPFKFPKSGR